jgi:hypothetical protein
VRAFAKGLAISILLLAPLLPAGAKRISIGVSAADVVIPGAQDALAIGDVNGDGTPDVLAFDCRGVEGIDRSYVLFGPFSGRVDIRKHDGFLIEEAKESDEACHGAPAGDVNGDGLDDLIVGAVAADNNLRNASGTAYVIFGKPDTEPVRLKDFDDLRQGSAGFRIDGARELDVVGGASAPIGDMNGDGLDDLIIGSPFAGSCYVVFGKKDPLPVDLLTFNLLIQGPRGWRIDTPSVSHNSQLSVDGAGDVNGDGIPDVVIGAHRNTYGRGSAYVIFGKSDLFPVDALNLQEGEGYRVRGPTKRSMAGEAVAGLGDMNGDGRSDVAIGVPTSSQFGSVYIVWGKADSETTNLRRLEVGGFRIRGGPHTVGGAGVGEVVAAAGDLNRDAIPDVLLGDPSANAFRRGSGAVYVIFGKRSSTLVRLAELAGRGFRIDGTEQFGHIGDVVSATDDVTGDGNRDVVFEGAWPQSHILSVTKRLFRHD